MYYIQCKRCKHPFLGGVPEFFNNAWYSRCTNCGSDIELTLQLKGAIDTQQQPTRYAVRSALGEDAGEPSIGYDRGVNWASIHDRRAN